MHVHQAFRQRYHHRQQICLLKRPTRCLPAAKHFRERLPVHEIHHQILRTVVPEEVSTLNDVRVSAEIDQRLCLVSEAAQAIREMLLAVRTPRRNGIPLPNGQFRREVLLDGNEVAQFVVAGTVHDAEAAVTQRGFHRVVAKGRSRCQRIPSVSLPGWHSNSMPLAMLTCPRGRTKNNVRSARKSARSFNEIYDASECQVLAGRRLRAPVRAWPRKRVSLLRGGGGPQERLARAGSPDWRVRSDWIRGRLGWSAGSSGSRSADLQRGFDSVAAWPHPVF